MNNDPSSITFALLDKEKGIPDPAPVVGEEYPLPAWYRSVRNVPLEQLTVEDISKACRQGIHLKQVVPLALKALGANPLEGEMYDGELLVSLKAVGRDYWSINTEDRASCLAILESSIVDFPEDVAEDANELLSNVVAP